MFSKNDKIALIASWDNKGTVFIRRGTVHSCGKKLMRVELANGKMLEDALYLQYLNTSPRNMHVVADDSNEALEAYGMKLAEDLLQSERARLNRCLEGNHGEGYDRAIRRDLDALHEARVEWK